MAGAPFGTAMPEALIGVTGLQCTERSLKDASAFEVAKNTFPKEFGGLVCKFETLPIGHLSPLPKARSFAKFGASGGVVLQDAEPAIAFKSRNLHRGDIVDFALA